MTLQRKIGDCLQFPFSLVPINLQRCWPHELKRSILRLFPVIKVQVLYFLCIGGCSEALGMQKKTITDAQITASSSYNSAHGPSNARLHFRSGHGKTGAWSAGTVDKNQWLQVDLGKKLEVTAIQTQGRYDGHQWVMSYTVSYSNDGKTFYPYQNHKVYEAK